MKEEAKCCISGSFNKGKDIIDRDIDTFNDLNVMVLAPSKGWLFLPRDSHIDRYDKGFRPLASERGLNVKQIEDNFLECIKKSDFLYIEAVGGYVGNSGFFEIGFAIANEIPVYSSESIILDSDFDIEIREILSKIQVATPEKAIKDFKEERTKRLEETRIGLIKFLA